MSCPLRDTVPLSRNSYDSRIERIFMERPRTYFNPRFIANGRAATAEHREWRKTVGDKGYVVVRGQQ